MLMKNNEIGLVIYRYGFSGFDIRERKHILFDRIRKQRHRPRSFDGSGHHSLVLGAIAGPAGRNNFGVSVHEATQKLRVFVVNGAHVVGAEIASFRRSRGSVLLGVEFHGHNGILCKKCGLC
jgi:hypothetical protein